MRRVTAQLRRARRSDHAWFITMSDTTSSQNPTWWHVDVCELVVDQSYMDGRGDAHDSAHGGAPCTLQLHRRARRIQGSRKRAQGGRS